MLMPFQAQGQGYKCSKDTHTDSMESLIAAPDPGEKGRGKCGPVVLRTVFLPAVLSHLGPEGMTSAMTLPW